jgi:RNA polymerase sigma-70 factor (ECF subfamily)
LAAARAGNQGASAAIYLEHHGKVLAIARSVLRLNLDLAEDVAQDVWLKVFAPRSRFDGNSSLGTWIYRIALNECFIEARRCRQESNGDSRLVSLEMEDDGDKVDATAWFAVADTALENVPARIDLAKIMRAMKPLERQALTMAYIEGLPEKEAAAQLGLALASVKSKMHHAKRRAQERHRQPRRPVLPAASGRCLGHQ